MKLRYVHPGYGARFSPTYAERISRSYHRPPQSFPDVQRFQGVSAAHPAECLGKRGNSCAGGQGRSGPGGRDAQINVAVNPASCHYPGN